MVPISPSIIAAAGTSNLTLVATCVVCACLLIRICLTKKEKPWVKASLVFSFLLLAALIAGRVLGNSAKSNTGNVQVIGNGNGTATGEGNTVNVDNQKNEENKK